MSKIENTLHHLKTRGFTMSVDEIVDQFTIRDIKEYISYLQQEITSKDETIKELITENVTMEVKFGLK